MLFLFYSYVFAKLYDTKKFENNSVGKLNM